MKTLSRGDCLMVSLGFRASAEKVSSGAGSIPERVTRGGSRWRPSPSVSDSTAGDTVHQRVVRSPKRGFGRGARWRTMELLRGDNGLFRGLRREP